MRIPAILLFLDPPNRQEEESSAGPQDADRSADLVSSVHFHGRIVSEGVGQKLSKGRKNVVAERLGFNHDESLSLAKAVAGLTAQSKGRRLGIFTPTQKELKKVRERKRGEECQSSALGVIWQRRT